MENICNFLFLAVAALQFIGAVPLDNQFERPQITFKVGGEEHTFDEDQPQLLFTDITEVCKTGVWVLYSNEDYAWLHGWNSVEILHEVEPVCRNVTSLMVQSARFAGIESNYSTPSATLYGARTLTGEALNIEFYSSQLTFEVHSILAINTDVELFQEPNFGGESYCVLPEDCLDGVCWLYSWNEDEMPWNVSAAQSARIGCSSESNK